MREEEKLREAQDLITRELQKKGADRVDALSWDQDPNDVAARIHRLVVFRGGEKSVLRSPNTSCSKTTAPNSGKNSYGAISTI